MSRITFRAILFASILAAVAWPTPGNAGLVSNLDVGERCYVASAGAGASIFPGVSPGAGAREYGCVSDRAAKETGVVASSYAGVVAGVPVSYMSFGGGAVEGYSGRVGIQRLAWRDGTATAKAVLEQASSSGPATTCLSIRSGDGGLLAESCVPLSDGEVSISAPVVRDSLYTVTLELSSDWMFPTANNATVRISSLIFA